MNPHQPPTPASSPQIRPPKSKLRLLLVLTIILIVTLLLLPAATFFGMFNDAADPVIMSMVNSILWLFAAALVVHSIVGLVTVLPYRKLTKSYRSMSYLYGITLLSIPLLLALAGISVLLGSAVAGGRTAFDGDSAQGQLLTFFGSLSFLGAFGIFCLSIACAVVSIQLIRKR